MTGNRGYTGDMTTQTTAVLDRQDFPPCWIQSATPQGVIEALRSGRRPVFSPALASPSASVSSSVEGGRKTNCLISGGAIKLRQAYGLSLDGKTKLAWSCELSVPGVIAPGALGLACLGSVGHSSLCLLPIFSTCRGGLAAPSPQTLPVWRSWDILQASQCQPLPEKVTI